MKRPLIITIGILTLLFFVALWVYLLAYGAPKQTREVFTNLGVLPSADRDVRIIDPNAIGENKVQLALGGSQLQQLTTRAVAGFGFASSTKDIVRYVEKGTGHIFEIDLNSGTEEQISVTTLPKTIHAVFSPEGYYVAIEIYEGYDTKTIVAALTDENTLDAMALPLNAENIVFPNERSVYFSISSDTKTIGYSMDLRSQTQSELFNLDLADLRVSWGRDIGGIYVAPKPTQSLEGYLYKVSGRTLTPVSGAQFGFTSFMNNTHTVSSFIQNERYATYSLRQGDESGQTILMIDDKCVFDSENADGVWCASPLTSPNGDYLESWYKGVVTSEDYLWYSNLEDQTSTLLGDLSSLAGRIIDVTDLTVNDKNNLLLFGNKLDGALWLYKVQ